MIYRTSFLRVLESSRRESTTRGGRAERRARFAVPAEHGDRAGERHSDWRAQLRSGRARFEPSWLVPPDGAKQRARPLLPVAWND